MEWKYKIPLKDASIFATIEQERNGKIPEELKSFVQEHNAATPSVIRFPVGNEERIFGAVLSFNQDDYDVDTVFSALRAVSDKELLPFGIDPFGNYVCCCLKNHEVLFWNHETGKTEPVAQTLEGFLELLY